jgi:hypothetical protein
MKILNTAFALFLGIYTPAQYGGPPMWDRGPDRRPERYDLPPCNPYYNPDCGRFGWEGPRARQWRHERYPMMPDAPRGPGYPYEGPPPYNPDE